jgi:hypothetical protein
MRFCKITAIIALFFSGVSVATAAPEGLSPADRAVLADYARDTWRSIAALADRGPLPADSLRRTEGGWVVDGLTSPTNIAAYLWSTAAAEDLRLISPEEAGQRIAKTLGVLGRLERVHGFFFNWYDPATGERARVWPGGGNFRPFLSVVDNGWLAAALILIGNTRPEFREATAALLGPMDFGFFCVLPARLHESFWLSCYGGGPRLGGPRWARVSISSYPLIWNAAGAAFRRGGGSGRRAAGFRKRSGRWPHGWRKPMGSVAPPRCSASITTV